MRPDTSQNTEHRLDEERRLDQPALEEMRQVIEVRGVVAFELEARAGVPQGRQDELNILVGVAKDEVARSLQRRPFPIELEVLEPAEHGKQAEIHRSHV